MRIVLEHQASVLAGQDYWSAVELLTPDTLVHPSCLLTLTRTKETVRDFWADISGCSSQCKPQSLGKVWGWADPETKATL